MAENEFENIEKLGFTPINNAKTRWRFKDFVLFFSRKSIKIYEMDRLIIQFYKYREKYMFEKFIEILTVHGESAALVDLRKRVREMTSTVKKITPTK